MSKSYTPVQSDHKFVDIIEHIFQQTDPVSAAAIAQALDIPHATVMSHLIVALERKWVRETGGRYEAGIRLPGLYSAYKMGLVGQIDQLNRKLALLEA